MVREGHQKSGEEAEEDGPAGRAGESHHHTELQHQVCHHSQVRQHEKLSAFLLLVQCRLELVSLRVNPNSLSYPFPLPLPLSFARSRESKGCPNSHFDRGVGLRGRGRYPLKPIIFASLLETKGYPEHATARSSRFP